MYIFQQLIECSSNLFSIHFFIEHYWLTLCNNVYLIKIYGQTLTTYFRQYIDLDRFISVL
jgi:hypothetical protein